MGKAQNKGKGISQIASEVGIVGLATKGLGTRVIMIGTLTGAFLHRLDFSIPANESSQASNGGSTIHSRLPWVWVPLVASKRC